VYKHINNDSNFEENKEYMDDHTLCKNLQVVKINHSISYIIASADSGLDISLSYI
jgi:hypothetical protein